MMLMNTMLTGRYIQLYCISTLYVGLTLPRAGPAVQTKTHDILISAGLNYYSANLE